MVARQFLLFQGISIQSLDHLLTDGVVRHSVVGRVTLQVHPLGRKYLQSNLSPRGPLSLDSHWSGNIEARLSLVESFPSDA